MNAESIRVLIAGGFFMLLLLLRLESDRFGAAEYDEPGRRRGGTWTRLSWYLIGLSLLAAIYYVHPAPHDVLYMLVGRPIDVLAVGALLALLGMAQAAAFASFRYGYFRLPPPAAYPGAAVNSIATAVIDEAAFRGVLLGTLVALGLPDAGAILVATLVYVAATRLAAPGRHPYMLLLAFGMGLAFGVATLITGGLGAAIIGHAVTSFALFVCTGHTGQVQPVGCEPEELERQKQLPEGWQDVRGPSIAGPGAEPRDLEEPIGPSGFADRAARRTAAARHSDGIVAWTRSMGRPSDRRAPKRSR
ncbi:MAG: CPBP family intramembrane glutamic endopeptidase [Candidatus Limnocylindrales bacterium]